MGTITAPDLAATDRAKIDAIVNKFKDRQGALLGILEESQKQNKNSYLSEEVLTYISFKTKVPLSRIYSVVTFYSFFNLKPQGKHNIVVCRGTACHTKGSKALLDDVAVLMGGEKELEGGEPTFTTSDNEFTVRTVACFGQCALAPVVAIDGVIHSNVTTIQMRKLVSKISKGRNLR
jgi:NADH-quinone oxidoreductase subunit E